MAKSKVAIVRCVSYNEKSVYDSVKKGIELLGGIESFVRKGEKILLKPNLLAGDIPEKAVTTHPSVLNAVIKVLLEHNIRIFYGDSPGFENPEKALAKAGLKQVADRYNLELGDFENGKVVEYPQAMVCSKFHVAKACLEADGIINISKMKTHGLTRITGAVKNMYGCITGFHKQTLHAKYPNSITFSKMLVDLNGKVKPRLSIMDGIVAMEGNGPRGGEPVKMNCLIFSADPVAVDATFCRIIDLNPEFIPTNKYGKAAELGNYDLKDIVYVGEPWQQFVNKRFKVSREPVGASILKFASPLVKNAFYDKPVIKPGNCTKCGVCVDACPVKGKALQFRTVNGKLDKKNPPVYGYDKCIRCYCCQEMCPFKAIYLKKPLLSRACKVFKKKRKFANSKNYLI